MLITEDMEKASKKCSCCRKNLPVKSFCNNRWCKDGLSHQCRGCTKISKARYYLKNSEKVKSDVVKWKSRNRDLALNLGSKWRKRNPDAHREWRKKNPKLERFNAYKRNSKVKGTLFDLPRELFDDLVTDNCFYCGSKPVVLNGIDRVDNSKGYFFGNVVTSCFDCNSGKGTKTRAEFESWVLRVVKHADVVGQPLS